MQFILVIGEQCAAATSLTATRGRIGCSGHGRLEEERSVDWCGRAAGAGSGGRSAGRGLSNGPVGVGGRARCEAASVKTDAGGAVRPGREREAVWGWETQGRGQPERLGGRKARWVEGRRPTQPGRGAGAGPRSDL